MKIDGEVVCCDESGLAIFSTLRRRVATLEEAKAEFQKSWDAWNAWAKMEEAP